MEIIINPEAERLMAEIKNLKEKLLALIEERDELIYHICPMIEAKYAEFIGTLELDALDMENKVREIKRKIEIVRAERSKGNSVTMEQVEAQVEDELKSYIVALKMAQQQNEEEKKRLSGDFLSDNEAKELKEIYRNIAKQLHPDLNENLTDEEKELFFKAAEAYKSGDIMLMRMLDTATKNIDAAAADESTMEKLKNQRDKLKLNTQTISALINDIKSDYPYNMRETISNRDRVIEIREKLQKVIEDYKAVYKEYEEEYAVLFS
ncbi:MAG: hypothetical protein ACI4J1_04310 [Ruminiclostridium sp.]